MNSKDFLEALVVGEQEEAHSNFNDIMSSKLSDVLEVKKVEIASGLFGEEVDLDEALLPAQLNVRNNLMDKELADNKSKTPASLRAAKQAKVAAAMLKRASDAKNEEVEHLDETFYDKTANMSPEKHRAIAADHEEKSNKYYDRASALKKDNQTSYKASREDSERNASDRGLDHKILSKMHSNEADRKERAAASGTRKALGARLKNEEVESLDELKKTTLRSYAAKRARQPDKGKNGFNIDRALTKAAGRPTFPGIKPAKVYGTNEETGLSETNIEAGSEPTVSAAAALSAVRSKVQMAKSRLGLKDLNVSAAVNGHAMYNKIAGQNPKLTPSQILQKLPRNAQTHYMKLTGSVPSGELDQDVPGSSYRRALQALKR